MKKKNVLLLILIAAVLISIEGCHKAFFKPRKLNLLLISIDTLRADYVSCYSNAHVQTKTIDSYCKKGIKFSAAFAHNPVTLPSHTNILTGATALFHNMHDNVGFRLNVANVTLAEHLKSYGYKTAAIIGGFPLDSRFGLDKGFDFYDDHYGERSAPGIFYFTERNADSVVQNSLNWLKNNKAGPWFLFVHFFDPHQPYIPPAPYKDTYKSNLYAGEVAYVDASLSKLFAFMEHEELMDSTLVIITSDHGEGLGEHGENTHGYFAYNSTLHVPLIFYSPYFFKKHQEISQIVSHVDIFPTICDLFGLDKLHHLQGESLTDLIFAGSQKIVHAHYFESLSAYYNRGWAPLRGFILGAVKYIELPVPEIYQIDKDFNELHNLSNELSQKKYNLQLHNLMNTLSSSQIKNERKIEDKQTMDVLKSLGYLGSSSFTTKTVFTSADDLKTLLPLHQELMNALLLFSEGKSKESISILKKLVSMRKDFTTAYAYLANIYHETGDLQSAIETLKEAISISPNNYDLKSQLGIYLVENNNPKEAINSIQQALKIADYDAEVWNYLGIAYWKLGDFTRAENAYKKALSLDTNYAGALNNMGSLYLSMQQYTMAEDYFKRALTFDPKLSSAYNGLGVVYYSSNNYEIALQQWKKAVELDQYNLLALYNYGKALAESSNKKEALPYLYKYLEIAPKDDPDRQKVIWRIEALKMH